MTPSGSPPYSFPIDAVFTWVDGADPAWREQKRLREASLRGESAPAPEDQDVSRFKDNDELKYALRSLAKFAPWIRTVHIVTANQKPSWLNTDTVHLVSHEDIFPDPSLLPVFSTRPIELCIHRTPGLAEHFIYANDDFMLGRPLSPKDFFLPDGDPRVWVVKRSKSHMKRQQQKKRRSSHENAVVRSCEVAKAMFGSDMPYRMRHYPKSMTIDTVRQMWELFPEAVAKTLASPFRSHEDISITMLYPLFLLATGQGKPRPVNGFRQLLDAVRGGIAHMGASLGDDNMEKKMQRIERMRPKTFCLNDGNAAAEKDRLTMRAFLERMFPEPSPFERT